MKALSIEAPRIKGALTKIIIKWFLNSNFIISKIIFYYKKI